MWTGQPCERCEKLGFELCQCKIKVLRTGNTFSISSSEFLITFPNHTAEFIWSPYWHNWDKAEEIRQAAIQAKELWNKRIAA